MVNCCGIPLYVLIDSKNQLVLEFFEAVCSMLSIKHVTVRAYHLQTNQRAERFNKTLFECLCHFFAEQKTERHEYVQPLTYVCLMQFHHTTGTPRSNCYSPVTSTAFSLSRSPRRSPILVRKQVLLLK